MSSYSKRVIKHDQKLLLDWYANNHRDLPWRKNRDPYRIWLSEIMLQQTTVKAVIPYFERFLKKFPTLKKLAGSELEEVYELWAGLGYYSRARSLHKAAKELDAMGAFPESYKELIKLPGFGDYTSRAVSSLAFGEKAGVVDGNVIRVMSRRWNRPWEHWQSRAKKEIQEIVDLYADCESPSSINQGLMELGATICTPKSPTCFLCPWQKKCEAYKADTHCGLPLKKPKRDSEIWQWQVDFFFKGDKIAFIKNEYAPFLKGQIILPGKVKLLSKSPEEYKFKHGITHYNIYVSLTRRKSKFPKSLEDKIIWISPKQLKQKVPFSLVQKAVAVGLADRNL